MQKHVYYMWKTLRYVLTYLLSELYLLQYYFRSINWAL